MALPSRSPGLPEVLALWEARINKYIRVALPCQVESYDATAQRVDVKPQVQDRYLDDSGVQQNDPLPVIPGVPVSWPAGGGMRLTFPLKSGDTGLVVFADRSIDDWLGLQSPADTTPADARRHALQDAVFIPGLRVGGQAFQNVSTSVAQIGADGSSASAVARMGDTVSAGATPTTGMAAWIALVTSAINSLAPGSIPPDAPSDFGKISSGSDAVEVLG